MLPPTTVCPESFGETRCIIFIWEGETRSGVLFLETLIRWTWEDLFLKGNKDHLVSQARSDLAKQELHVESVNKCIGEQQRQTGEQRLALRHAQYGFVESRREQVRLQEELSMKEKVLQKTQIGNVHTKWDKLRNLKISE